MKKYFLLFAAGGLLTLASCGGENTPTETINVDSLAQVKVDSIAAAEKAISDSTIAAQAVKTADSLRMVMRDDSIAAAAAKAAGRKAPAKKAVVTKSTTTEVIATPEPVIDPQKKRNNDAPTNPANNVEQQKKRNK